ncbi:YceI family protein [soil metagenome]
MAITRWIVDPAHSEILFKVKHLMMTTVSGYFRKFHVEVETEGEDFTKASKILFMADVNSVDTNNEERDAHLRSTDFFYAENHPQITFEGIDYERDGDDFQLHGDLTIRGVTKRVTAYVEFSGVLKDQHDNTKAGFVVDTKLNRKDFGLVWNAITEAGSVVVSDEIKVHCEIQLIKQ